MNNGQEIWDRVVTSYKAYFEAMSHFLQDDIDRVSLLKKGLHGSDRYTAIYILQFLKVEELQQLFEELVFFASFGHGAVGTVRGVIKSLPKEWVIDHIEAAAEPLLVNGTYDEYQSFLELYIEMDQGLTRRLAQRAAQNADLDIRETGEYYLTKLLP